MVAKAKLSDAEWLAVRQAWESDPRTKLSWLVDELNLPVSQEAVRLRKKSEEWTKGGKPSLEEKPKIGKQKNKLGNKKPSLQTTKAKFVKQIPPIKPKPEPEWEAVDESKDIHGNSSYMPHYDELAYKFCLLGANDQDLANLFNVETRTIYEWKLRHKNFAQALRSGKEIADSNVALSFYKRACGFKTSEVKTKQVLVPDDERLEGYDEMKVVEVITTEKEVPPDSTAAIMWLKNRNAANWKDKQEVTTHHTVDKEMLEKIETDYLVKINAADERQRQVLIERGIIEQD